MLLVVSHLLVDVVIVKGLLLIVDVAGLGNPLRMDLQNVKAIGLIRLVVGIVDIQMRPDGRIVQV